ncbi:DNA primase [Paralcaligenes ureilyticus]|uniref:DNA primase n=1 Tax=Paralcaligenes ureilyticus TaxID=627131 RepID=A0A4R3M288_9BURK|nr:DNA primase [Paralcaligenes ureilyticus]TCT05327.1 DNA primase [Paralcaligenes ureilyticus]
MIPEPFVQDLLARVDVVDVVGRYVALRKGGANLLGLCPFHNEKSPSFTVSPTKQFYHCFGCGAHGSAITFLMEHTGASFPEAVRSLAAGAGMTVPEEPRSPQQRAATQRHKQEASRHQQILDTAQSHYLSELKASAAAIAYLKKRGLNGQIAARFGLGWSGTDRRGLAAVFPHYEDPLLIESGLVIESEDGRRYDRFRERVMFPIRNGRGNLIGFGGRIIGRGEPKYLNSPETALFSKGRELYGLWEGRAGIRAQGYVLVVEGYMDVVGLAQQGVENAVATLGTATTVEHIQKLLRTSDKIIFSFDGDGAGRRAAWRALQVCLPMLRDDVSIRFLFLPTEHDPDSYVREYGAEAFRASAAEAVPLSRFMLEELAARHAMDEAEGRAACVHEAKPLLASLPEGTVLRVQIEREFARLVQLTPEELAAMLAAAPAFKAALTIAPLPGEYDSAGPSASPQWPGSSGPDLGDEPYFEPAPAGEFQPQPAGRTRRGANRHSVMPMAKRLLRLLLAHPGLVENLGDQQLEVLEHGPHLIMVRELLALAHASGARHVGALLQAADPGSDLAEVLSALSIELLSQDDLPDPQAEWNDALRHIEIDALRAEQSSLVQAGLHDDAARKRYQELTRQITLLNNVSSH